jgi:hypothetical protein
MKTILVIWNCMISSDPGLSLPSEGLAWGAFL